jgi:hypothetical protein
MQAVILPQDLVGPVLGRIFAGGGAVPLVIARTARFVVVVQVAQLIAVLLVAAIPEVDQAGLTVLDGVFFGLAGANERLIQHLYYSFDFWRVRYQVTATASIMSRTAATKTRRPARQCGSSIC